MNFFGKVFNGLGHAIAWIFSKAIPVTATVAQDAQAVVDSPIGTLVAAAFGPQGAAIKSDVEAIAGSVLAARNALGDAFSAKAADLGLDQKALQAVESIYSQIAGLVHGHTAAPTKSISAQQLA